MTAIVTLFADGGVIGRNPSPIGGTWAWVAVDAAGDVVAQASGVLPAPPGSTVSNNFAEFAAAVQALEQMPDGWAGTLASDSAVTLGRLCSGWTLAGIPLAWVQRGAAVLQRLGPITPLLLQGHPTRADLARGIGSKRGYPVSIHNVTCDRLCQEAGRAYLAEIDLKLVGQNA